MRMVLKNILTENGYHVVGEAGNGDQALELYDQYKPDLVTMDIIMPERDGISTVKALLDKDPAARVIMVTAVGQQGMVDEALAAGARGYVVKPFQAEKVVEEISKVL